MDLGRLRLNGKSQAVNFWPEEEADQANRRLAGAVGAAKVVTKVCKTISQDRANGSAKGLQTRQSSGAYHGVSFTAR